MRSKLMMSCKQTEAKRELERNLKEGIHNLIRLYCYRNNAQYMAVYKKEWTGSVYRNVSCDVVDKKGMPYLTEKIEDDVISTNLAEKKFDAHFSNAMTYCEYEDMLPINPADKESAKEFVSEYLEWAKPLLLQKPEIAKNQVRAKLDEMLEKRKEAERQDDGL